METKETPMGVRRTRNRMPELFEVLCRQTLPPVDLFSFYIFMRDQQRSVDYLDFWLDVAQHMSLCRHYVRNLRRSVMVGTPEGEKSQSKRSSQILEQIGDMEHPPAGPSMFSTDKEKTQDAQLSAYLREEAANGGPPSRSGSFGSHGQTTSIERPRPSFMSSPIVTTDSNSPNNASVTREDLTASAEKILYTYLLPGAEREITLPDDIVSDITRAIEEQNRNDPEVFDRAKDYVFQAMERDAYPPFLMQKALGNLIPSSMIIRAIVGLLAMFGGFWTGFIMIFLDYSRLHRLWIIIPFTVGVYFLTTHQYGLDPILAIIGLSEYTLFSFSRIKEPYIRRLLIRRSFTALSVIFAVTAALVILFVFVPGKRL